MNKENALKVIGRFRDILVLKGIRVDRIVLFGSYADGTQRADSDIDLVVVSESFEGMEYWKRIDVLSDAISEIFQPIEATGMTESEWRSRKYAVSGYARNGQIVA